MADDPVSALTRDLMWGTTYGDPTPRIFVIAGPNGAGKSTTAPLLLHQHEGVHDYVNVDVIAAGLSSHATERIALQAGRIMVQRMRTLHHARRPFAFETTLATRSYAPWLVKCQRGGYKVSLLFLSLSSSEVALARVAERVLKGGHNVSERIVRRRFERGLANFFTLYRPIVDHWSLIDNSLVAAPVVVAYGGSNFASRALQPDTYALWEERYGRV
ncbi:MAG: zeta toxin family protein [Magnetococcales bacterium]|nr:zeta toxin family protein [Magnetococcales bacterium]